MMASKGVSVAMPEASKVADLVKDGPNGSGDGAATKDKHQQEAVLPTKLVRKSPVFFNVPCLTGLRGIAALGVVAGHLTGGTGAHIYFNGWEALQEMGNVAVLFFFVLSAFLLTVRALTERQRPADARYLRWSANGILIPWLSVRWIKYLIRRSFRILPLYWVVLVLIAAISWLHGAYGDLRNYEPFGWGRVLPYAFFYDVNSIFWTIPPEFEYYLVMPFYIVLYEMAERKDKMGEWTMGTSENPPAYPYGLGTAEIAMKEHYRKGLHNRVVHYYYRFGRRVVLLLALSLFNVLIVPIFWSARGVVNYYHIPAFMGRFWIGSLAAFIYHMFAQYGYVIYDSAPKTKNVNQKFSNLASKWISTFCDLILWLLVIGLFLSVPYYARLILRKQVPREPLSYYADNMGMWPVGGSALLVFLVSFGCRDRSFARFSSWSFFNYAGEISFPLYMTHPIAIHLTQEKEIEGIDGFLFTFGFSLVIASVLHFAVEKPVGMMAGKLAKWVQVTHFSKDPKLPVDVDKHDEIAAKRYTEMGLKPASHEAFGDTSVGDEKRTVLPVTSAVAVLQAPRGKSSGPLFQVVSIDHNEEKAQAPEYETIADEPADAYRTAQ
ncbi:acyltransferase family-domain-containing protein [Powellomyces hirtus]|nr:acyltransferase family-domain-containing protein [Powellomyces hirtus]